MPRRIVQFPSRNLRELRVLAGLSPRDLAELAEVSSRTIDGAENTRVPRPGTQIKIAAALSSALGTARPTYPRPLTHMDLWPLEEKKAGVEVAA